MLSEYASLKDIQKTGKKGTKQREKIVWEKEGLASSSESIDSSQFMKAQ
jgi:hypothetical protein